MIPARRPQRYPQRYPERMPPTFVSGDLYFNGELLVPVNTTQGVGPYGPTVIFDGATSELQDKNGRKVLEVNTTGTLSRLSYGNNGPIYFDGDMTRIRFDGDASPALTGTFHEDAVKKCVSLISFYGNSNTFTGPLPDFSKCTNLYTVYINIGTFTGPLPDFSKCLALVEFRGYLNLLSGVIPDFGQCPNLSTLQLNNNLWNSAEISDLIDNLWSARVALGGNSCEIKVQNNAIPDSDAIAKIEGTGVYAGDGLKDNGCTVTYDT